MSRADELRALIARVEAATAPDFALGVQVLQAVGRTGLEVNPVYSIDAAASLVPEGHNWSLDMLCRDGNEARTFFGPHPHEIDTEATGATPALALTAAALRARLAMEEQA